MQKQGQGQSVSTSKQELQFPSAQADHDHHPLRSARVHRSSGGSCEWRGRTEQQRVCETTAALSSFKYNVWKHFGFSESRNEEEEKVTDKQTDRKEYKTDTAGLEPIHTCGTFFPKNSSIIGPLDFFPPKSLLWFFFDN